MVALLPSTSFSEEAGMFAAVKGMIAEKTDAVKADTVKALTATSAAVTISASEAEKAYKAWREAIASRKTENILAQYKDNATLLPTLSAKVITGQKERGEYFDGLVKKEGLNVKPLTAKTTTYGNVAVTNGTYNFSFKDAGKEQTVNARFTFVFEKDSKGEVKIATQHSSIVPKN